MSSRAVFRAGIAAAISPVVETPIFLDGPFCAAENERPVRGESHSSAPFVKNQLFQRKQLKPPADSCRWSVNMDRTCVKIDTPLTHACSPEVLWREVRDASS